MPNLTTTIGVIKSFNPCKGGYKKLIKSIPGYTDDTKISLSCVLENNSVEDAVWFLRCFEYKEYCLFCADVLELTIPHFEKKYQSITTPRELMNGIRGYKKGEICFRELKRLKSVVDDLAVLGAHDNTIYYILSAASHSISSALSTMGYAVKSETIKCHDRSTSGVYYHALACGHYPEKAVQMMAIEELLIKFINS